MYLEYFSLTRHPFRITPDPSLFFPGGAHGRGVVLDALVYAITSGEGILKVVGEVGSGKTMLCRMLEEKLPANVEIVYLANPNLSARDIIYAIAFELKLEVDSSTDRLLVMQKIQQYLLKRHGEGANVVVFIEEAQSMPLETLEEVRLLSNLETHRHKLMQIVLFGQPELDRKLQSKAIRQLSERITHSFNLEPLTENEIREYLHFRVRAAGCPWPQLFAPRAEKMLAAASGGLTRRVNILADKALLASYADPATRPQARNSSGEMLPMVLPRHVKTAIADSGYRRLQTTAVLPYVGYGLATVSTLALVFVLFFSKPEEAPVQASPVQAPASKVLVPEPELTLPTASTQNAGQGTVPADRIVTGNIAAVVSNRDTDNTAAPVAIASSAETPREVEAQLSAAPASAEPLTVSAPLSRVVASVVASIDEPIDVAMTTQVSGSQSPSSSETEKALPLQSAESTIQNEVRPVTTVARNKNPAVQNLISSLRGLAALRMEPTDAWLEQVPSKTSYTAQLFSISIRDTEQLDEMLEFLSLTAMLDETYICVISGKSGNPEQWLVMYGDFAGLSEVRTFINALPPFISKYRPYARNLADIACMN